MTDDGSRFDAFEQVEGDADDEQDADPDEPATDDAPDAERSPTDPADVPAPEPDATPRDDAEPDADDALQDKAFPYSAAKQTPVYAREQEWEDYDEVVQFDVERELHDRGITNPQKRELHEATLRVARKHPELLVEEFLELRREG